MSKRKRKYVYEFAEGSREMRDLLGGKGANVAEMTRILGADRVPAGFTITTEACVAYMGADRVYPAGLQEQIDTALERLEQAAGRQLGDAHDPLLVSVRSGARASMPGMMDTVLNLGLTDESVSGLAKATDNPRFAWDSYRRLVQMFANVVRGVPGEKLEAAIDTVKKTRGVTLDTELTVEDLQELVDRFKVLLEETTGEAFPQDPRKQLDEAVRAVFDSWRGERATSYRRINKIPDDWGTAVNVQQMVFGNKGDTSGSGVAFSRDEITGGPEPSGDFLINAQGEDVVSGVRNTQDLKDLAELMPEAHATLMEILQQARAPLRRHAGHGVHDRGRPPVHAPDAGRQAPRAGGGCGLPVTPSTRGCSSEAQALATLDAAKLEALLHPTFDPSVDYNVVAHGVGASPGAGQGEVVFTAVAAVLAAEQGRAVVLVRPFTEAEDVAGFHAAKGILTSEGGKASHAALVARGMGRPCVVGASELDVDVAGGVIRVDGDRDPRRRPHRHRRHHRCDHNRRGAARGARDDRRLPSRPRLGRRAAHASACARTPTRPRMPARPANSAPRASGCAGPSTCSWPPIASRRCAAMILADTLELRARGARCSCCRCSRPTSRACSRRWPGCRSTIRLLDPPLHEFLPSPTELSVEVERARDTANRGRGHAARGAARAGRRRSRRSTRCSARAAAASASCIPRSTRCRCGRSRAPRSPSASGRARRPQLEIMVPLVAYERELEVVRELIERVAAEEGLEVGHGLHASAR